MDVKRWILIVLTVLLPASGLGRRILGFSPEDRVRVLVDSSDFLIVPAIWRDPYLGVEFVWVPGGCHEMGCGEWMSYCGSDEEPVHKVCADGFWMGRYEVTRGQRKRFLRETGYNWNERDCVDKYAPGDDHPVVRVSWHDAKAYAEWLSQKTGYKFRLPTEAEWEHACRSAGRKVKYGTATAELSHDLANYDPTLTPFQQKYKDFKVLEAHYPHVPLHPHPGPQAPSPAASSLRL